MWIKRLVIIAALSAALFAAGLFVIDSGSSDAAVEACVSCPFD